SERFFDHSGQIRHRDIGDLMRYVALNQGMDNYSRYGDVRLMDIYNPKPDPTKLKRYSDAQLYALALYVYALKSPENPNRPSDLSKKGEAIFRREKCSGCHSGPDYSNRRLTRADGFEPGEGVGPTAAERMNLSVGTDPGLALHTGRGTGYYKVPSLKGLW